MGSDFTNKVFNDFFNVTMSYRSNADAIRSYGGFIRLSDGKVMDPEQEWMDFKSKSNQSLPTGLNPLANRRKDILWVVSHCKAKSRREEYVKKLKKATNLKVDIYGKCSRKPVPGDKKSVKSGHDKNVARLISEYKFYLGFENTLCEDYVTEKFYDILKNGGLPVVNGGLAKSDYNAPPHSFIHVDDFGSPEDLAQELEKLSQNRSAYEDYFWWRNHYKLRPHGEINRSAQCQLCQILNNPTGFVSKNDYSNFHIYWDKCRKPKI